VDRRHCERLWEERSDAEHRVDGIVLQRSDTLYTFGTAKNLSVLKWKEHPSVDLKGLRDDLHAVDGPLPSHILGKPVRVAESRISAKSAEDVLEYSITAFPKYIELFAIRVRLDKGHANSLHVVSATISDVIDEITVAEISGSDLGLLV